MENAIDIIILYIPCFMIDQIDAYMGIRQNKYLRWNNFQGQRNRRNLPAEIEYDGDKIKAERWCKNGKFHRVTGPSLIFYNQKGTIITEIWCRDGIYHRENGFSYIIYYDTGTIFNELWLNSCGQEHNVNGPSKHVYNIQGIIQVIEWKQNDKLHRIDGPARLIYNEEGSLIETLWYNDGIKINGVDNHYS